MNQGAQEGWIWVGGDATCKKPISCERTPRTTELDGLIPANRNLA